MKITLLGYMASGKTTLGKELSAAYNLPFYDLDRYIEMKTNATIKALLAVKNGMYFRKIERQFLLEILNLPKFILASGGGTPCYYNNLQEINSKSISFYLSETPKNLTSRLRKLTDKESRPLVANVAEKDLLEFVAKHLFERRLFYDQAHNTIAGEDKFKQIEKILNAQ